MYTAENLAKRKANRHDLRVTKALTTMWTSCKRHLDDDDNDWLDKEEYRNFHNRLVDVFKRSHGPQGRKEGEGVEDDAHAVNFAEY